MLLFIGNREIAAKQQQPIARAKPPSPYLQESYSCGKIKVGSKQHITHSFLAVEEKQ
jgi:hypothetical protein